MKEFREYMEEVLNEMKLNREGALLLNQTLSKYPELKTKMASGDTSAQKKLVKYFSSDPQKMAKLKELTSSKKFINVLSAMMAGKKARDIVRGTTGQRVSIRKIPQKK